MKIAIIGGHLTPALAVIQKLSKDAEVIYIGRKYPIEGDKGISLEYQTITSLQIPFILLTTGKLQRRFTRHTIPSLAKLPSGMSQAFRILRKYKPDVVISFGGYLGIPVCFAAYILKIPIVLHEQTTQAGMANKITSLFAKKICISFESSKAFFPKTKTILTGNPIPEVMPTKDIENYKKQNNAIPLLVITGGSQGSHIINQLIKENLPELLRNYQLIHQTGDAREYNDFDELEKIKLSLPIAIQKRYKITKFIRPFDITEVYKRADLVISRAGINTVLMLILLNKPAIFIPLPYGQHNEQLKNAQMFKTAGLGEILIQHSTTSDVLYKTIQTMIKNLDAYTNKNPEMIETHKHAAEKIIEIIKQSVKRKA